jgi:hypothetical protein
MAYELREGQGSLFKNDRKEKDTHPNARGEALIGGVVYEISAWTKEGRKGKFQSLAFKPKQPRSAGDSDRQYEDSRRDPEDTIPF